jgi:hypothetical protein
MIPPKSAQEKLFLNNALTVASIEKTQFDVDFE